MAVVVDVGYLAVVVLVMVLVVPLRGALRERCVVYLAVGAFHYHIRMR